MDAYGYSRTLLCAGSTPALRPLVDGDPAHAGSLSACETALEGLIDPVAVDRAAKADQEERLALGGGIEAIIEQGSLGYTPAPGETPEYM